MIPLQPFLMMLSMSQLRLHDAESMYKVDKSYSTYIYV